MHTGNERSYMNIKQLKYVLILAEEGSFVRAAEKIGISQPSLSQYVKKIEQDVGMELFIRTVGEVRLTDAGRIYIEAGKKILELEHGMQNSFSDVSAYKTGSLIVGTSPYRSASMMPKVIRKFREMYPGMHIVVEEMTSSELVDELEHGRFDLCLTLAPVNTHLFSREKIAEEELILAVPASFPPIDAAAEPGKRYPAIDAHFIDGRYFITITETQSMQRTLDDLCHDYGISVRKAAVVKSLEAQIAMVRAGVGMALVPTGIETFCAEGEVTFYSFRQSLPRRDVVAIWRKDRKLNRASQDLLEIMKQSLG